MFSFAVNNYCTYSNCTLTLLVIFENLGPPWSTSTLDSCAKAATTATTYQVLLLLLYGASFKKQGSQKESHAGIINFAVEMPMC